MTLHQSLLVFLWRVFRRWFVWGPAFLATVYGFYVLYESHIPDGYRIPATWQPTGVLGLKSSLYFLGLMALISAALEVDRLWREAHRDKEREAFEELLAAARDQGNAIRTMAPDDIAFRCHNSWVEQTQSLVADGLGKGQAQKFMSDDGLPVAYGNDSPASQMSTSFGRRMARLNEINEHLPKAKIRKGFDAKRWEGVFDEPPS